MTGREAAERLLRGAGIYDVRVEYVSGNLTDHYDPRNKVLRLSGATYNQCSVAAIGVAAHECGHAIQHARGYVPLKPVSYTHLDVYKRQLMYLVTSSWVSTPLTWK